MIGVRSNFGSQGITRCHARRRRKRRKRWSASITGRRICARIANGFMTATFMRLPLIITGLKAVSLRGHDRRSSDILTSSRGSMIFPRKTAARFWMKRTHAILRRRATRWNGSCGTVCGFLKSTAARQTAAEKKNRIRAPRCCGRCASWTGKWS